MSGKEKPGVTRRPNRGRSSHDSKSKTDSGCFVDDELEKNCSSDSSQGSNVSSPGQETYAKKTKPADERKVDSVTPVPSPEPTVVNGNAQECNFHLKENVMNEGGATDNTNERTSTENEDGACGIVERTRQASDFYCLYYSESPKGTLTRSNVTKVKSKPPVAPKPKARRSSAPPSSFNNIEKICLQSKDITKRFSYNEGENGRTMPSLENFDQHEKRKSVEERVLFFEAVAKDGLVENMLLKNVQSSSFRNLPDNHVQTKLTSWSENGFHSVCSSDVDSEKGGPLANSEELSFEESNSEPLNPSHIEQEHSPPLVKEEEFTIDGSILQKRSVDHDSVSGDCHDSAVEREFFNCVSAIDEFEDARPVAVNKNPDQVSNISFCESECFSDLLLAEESRKDVNTNSVVSEIPNGFESFDISVPEDDNNLQLVSKINVSSEVTHQSNDCTYNTTADLENNHKRGLRGTLVNPRVNEIRQELSIGSRRHEGNGIQRRSGSIAGISNLQKDSTSQLKRRSWSFSEPHPPEIKSPFVRKNNQVSSPKLTPTSWQSEDGLSSPCVRSCYQDRPGQITPGHVSISQDSIGYSSERQPWSAPLEHSGYTSDDSSVHSEPLFQPLRRRPQTLNHGHIFKSFSHDSCISAMDNGLTSLSTTQHKRFRHSLGRRIGSSDPVYALRRQSAEFAQDSPHFQPVSHVQVPRLRSLRRTSSNASSSSDSEVERILSYSEPATTASPQVIKPRIHNGLVSTGGKRRVSAMEALFGPQSSRKTYTTQVSSNSEQQPRMSFSKRVCEFLPPPPEDEFLSGELAEEEQEIEFDVNEPKEIEEPRLEFDDTDYSEFYTRCEDKDSIISAEALSIKKLLQSPQTVLPDPDIESVVVSVTERRVIPTPLDDQNMREGASVAYDNDTCDTNTHKAKHSGQFCRQHRGTQTPPAEVFRALSPPPSVGTQTPPMSVSQELLPPSLLRELQKDLQSPSPMMTRTMSPSTSQEWQSSSQDHFRAVSPSCAQFADTDLLSSLQKNADKAVSVEELLQILANMRVGPPNLETPKRRPVSVQKYQCSDSTQDVNSRNSTTSLPSSWCHLGNGTSMQDDSGDFKQPSGIPPRFSKSYDCLRHGITHKGKRSGVIQARNAESRESREDIRQKLKEWRLRSQLFEEEVECLEDKDKVAKGKGEKVLTVSYEGSESTENIETESKLTRTHSLKRPRKDRAFSQKEISEFESSGLDEKQQQFSFPTPKHNCDDDDGELQGSSISSAKEVSKLELTSDSLLLEKLQNAIDGTQLHEVASPEGVDVFIDYRRKHGMHITSTPKPPPYPDKGLVCREGGVGKMNFEKPVTESLSADKPVSTNATEEVPVDLESQGDASSSSYSSDDDRFGEFGGSTDTVVFVDTEHSSGMPLVPDLDALDINLVGNNNLLSIDNGNDDGKDGDRLDVLLGEVRRSLNLEFVDSDILDKAIERFKQRVSPGSQDKALSDGLSMEAYVALHQADELQGIIGEIKGELKLLHDENDMLRERVVSLANQQTNGETGETSSTESSERTLRGLENLYKLYKPKHITSETDEEEDTVEVDVCLRGFSVVPLGHLPGKKRDIHLGTVSVKGADWNGVMEAARRTFVEHIKKIDPNDYLCLGAHSIQGVQTGVIVWSPDTLRRKSPRVELSQKSNPCVIQLKDGSHFSCDSLVYDTLLPKETIEKYVEQLLEHRYIVLCGEQGLGKSYLAAKLAEHVVQRIGWKGSPGVVTFNVTQATRKELKQNLANIMQPDNSSPQESRPAVIVLDQLNCLASLADIFDLSQLEKDRNCPYIIGVRDKSRKGPFSSKELSLCHYFRWLRVSVKDRQYSGLLGRFLRRKLSWTRVQNEVEGEDLLHLFNWLTKVWYHLNEILEEYCEPDTTIGPSLFFSCPMDYNTAEGWFVTVWNYIVIPYLHQALRNGRKIFDRCVSWEDPTKWVVLRYPWNKDHSRFLHTLRKLRQVDVVLNRNHLGSDNVCFAECIEENEKILRAHSTVSKRVRTVVQQKVPKEDSKTKRKNSEEMEFLGHEDYKDSCCSDSDSYLETSI